jgi:hypothetical protein
MELHLDQSRLVTLRLEHRRLAREYAEVKDRVGEYNARRYLLPGEDLERKALQRLKLHKKDTLTSLAAEIERLERARASAS